MKCAKIKLKKKPKKMFPDLIASFAQAIKAHEGWFLPGEGGHPKGSLSYQNSNPGNLRYTSYTASLGAPRADARGFCRFNTYNDGFFALCTMLKDACTNKLKAYRSTMTLRDFFHVYAPVRDSNDPDAYAIDVSKKTGVGVDAPISTFVT